MIIIVIRIIIFCVWGFIFVIDLEGFRFNKDYCFFLGRMSIRRV